MKHREKLCFECGQPMLPKGQIKRPDEYDHASGCPREAPPVKKAKSARN